ncbi:MAG: GNAT family N-acetyltransferase [Caulobacter sp.]|nr:GNAT family N-acetyltransferase [Caulobacter sp.]
MSLEPATPDDIPVIMAIERDPAYALFIAHFDAQEHAARMASANERYLVWREDGRVLAFAILSKLEDPNQIVLLKRLGAAATDTGLSRRLMPALIDLVFETTPANRFELDVTSSNPRAQHVYRREGFVHEGTLREVYRHDDGVHYSSHLYSMLRREWEALPRRRPSPTTPRPS